ncbi:MAG TPA: hypothetical protein PKH98_06380, partial [Candidatus Omnitrophota bacterium]|nr:hypothetical protein [Candidatus Omnitrophota bacterium]
MSPAFTPQALKQIKYIHRLSRQLNGKKKSSHEKKILCLMRQHIDEITNLYQIKNMHYLIETGDLLILCLEILIENKRSINAVFGRCINRYDKKIQS